MGLLQLNNSQCTLSMYYACTVYVQCGLLYNQEPRYIVLESVVQLNYGLLLYLHMLHICFLYIIIIIAVYNVKMITHNYTADTCSCLQLDAASWLHMAAHDQTYRGGHNHRNHFFVCISPRLEDTILKQLIQNPLTSSYRSMKQVVYMSQKYVDYLLIIFNLYNIHGNHLQLSPTAVTTS